MPNWVAGDTGDGDGRRGGGVALAVEHGIAYVLAGINPVADCAVTQVDRIDIAHGGSKVTGGTTGRGRYHVVLDRGRRHRVVEGVLDAMAVGAVLDLTGDAVGNGVNDLLPCAGMTLGAGVFRLIEGHDMDNTGGSRVRAIVTG